MPLRSDRFYVYVIFRQNGVPCYVGKGTRGRWLAHVTRSHNSHLQRIYAKAGGNLPIVKVRDGLTDEEAVATEIALIAAIGRRSHGGPLVNRSDGGESLTGRVIDEETRAKMSAAAMGRTLSPAHRAAIGAGHRGRLSDAKRAALNIARTKRRFDAASREKIAQAKRGLKQSPETIEKRVSRWRGVPRDPEMMERLRQRHIGSKRSPESRAKISKAQTGRRRAVSCP